MLDVPGAKGALVFTVTLPGVLQPLAVAVTVKGVETSKPLA
jgi:hypothetical protein